MKQLNALTILVHKLHRVLARIGNPKNIRLQLDAIIIDAVNKTVEECFTVTRWLKFIPMNVVVQLESCFFCFRTCFRQNVCRLVDNLQSHGIRFRSFEPRNSCIFCTKLLCRLHNFGRIFPPVVQLVPVQGKHFQAGSIQLSFEFLGLSNNDWSIKAFNIIKSQVPDLFQRPGYIFFQIITEGPKLCGNFGFGCIRFNGFFFSFST